MALDFWIGGVPVECASIHLSVGFKRVRREAPLYVYTAGHVFLMISVVRIEKGNVMVADIGGHEDGTERYLGCDEVASC